MVTIDGGTSTSGAQGLDPNMLQELDCPDYVPLFTNIFKRYAVPLQLLL